VEHHMDLVAPSIFRFGMQGLVDLLFLVSTYLDSRGEF
jgi:hypothetical protein